MLSKKMAVSLTSLITILALAFVAPSVMAGDFGGSLTAELTTDVTGVRSDDVSHADGIQLHKTTATAVPDVTLNVKFDKVVALTAAQAQAAAEVFTDADVKVQTYTMDGALTAAAATVGAPVLGSPADGKNFTVPITTLDAATYKMYVQIAKGAVGAADVGVGDDDDANAKLELTVTFLDPNVTAATPAGTATPDVLKIARVGEPFETVTSAEFMLHVLLTEEPMGGFKADHIDLGDNATVSSVVKLASPAGTMTAEDAGLVIGTDPRQIAAGTLLNALDSWRDGDLHLYLVTVKTKPGEKTVVVKIKNFSGMERPPAGTAQEMYIRAADSALLEGRDQLTVKTKTADPKEAKAAGVKFGLPKEKYIPGGGYLVVAEEKAGSSVHVPPGEIKEAPKPHERTPAELIYNVIDDGDLPNLETHLANGGTIGVMGPHALMITEIMWGSDASLDDPGKSQWVELYNAGAGYQTQDGDNTTYLIFYGPGEAPTTGLHDLVGTVDPTAGFWSIAGKGQSGRTAEKVQGEAVQAVQTTPLISMSRVMDAAGALAPGTLASSWIASTPPSSNFEVNRLGVHVGSPGAMPVTFPEPPAPPAEPTPAPVIPVAGAMDIMITEIMVDTGSGRLPQWIELTNVSGAEKSLAGWSLMISNAAADADVIGATVNINLSGTLGVGGGEGMGGTMGKSLLLVGGSARSSSNLADSDRVVDISSQVGQRGRYTFISAMGFMAALIPPQTTGILTYGDAAGNLGAAAAWDIPMDEDGRSSLIRREMDAAGMATMGTDANGWVLASETPLVSGPATWYGSDEDAGTPGYDAGGPLPVELSHFRPARDKATGAVVITWSTQSELNNAGFFIKRSQQRDGEFKVINATMIAGAGTTSEKQTYTYTDTTAQPNIVYYYQIEDVSLDGNRQTLTLGTRLKGHVGAAGKATTTWGELKTSHE